ncbi:MAG TPA: ABC transporter ATP-binding protein [Methylomirabilota bacterium]
MLSDDLVQLDGVAKHFAVGGGFFGRMAARVKAVDGVSFGIREGQTFGLVGESGCGKSTIAMLLVKLLEPTAGRLTFERADLARLDRGAMKDFRRHVQIVFQDPYGSLDPRQTMLKALMEPLFTLKVVANRAAALARAERALEMVGLDREVLKRLPHELSGGQRQRLVVARALAVGPRFVILDEPTSSVDVSLQAQILSLLADLKRRQGLTYLLISHNLVVIRYMSDVVAVMYLGKIVEMASSEELFTRPLHPYTVALISAIPVPDPEASAITALAKGDVPSAVNVPSGCRYHPRCPYAQAVCREQEPPLRELRAGHYGACHFPGVAAGGTIPA